MKIYLLVVINAAGNPEVVSSHDSKEEARAAAVCFKPNEAAGWKENRRRRKCRPMIQEMELEVMS